DLDWSVGLRNIRRDEHYLLFVVKRVDAKRPLIHVMQVLYHVIDPPIPVPTSRGLSDEQRVGRFPHHPFDGSDVVLVLGVNKVLVKTLDLRCLFRLAGLVLLPLAKREYQIQVRTVWQVSHVGHSVRTVATQGAELVLRLMWANDHNVWPNVKLVSLP